MKARVGRWAALLAAGAGWPWLVGTTDYGCPELRTELVSLLVNARDEIDPELPVPELVSAEQVDLPVIVDGGCGGGRDDCSGVSYVRFVFRNLTRPVVIFVGVGGTSRTTACDINTGTAGVELESGDYEFRLEGQLDFGPICVQNLGPDGRRSRPLQVYMPEWLAEHGGGGDGG